MGGGGGEGGVEDTFSHELLRESNKQSRIFRLNDVIMAGISVQIPNNTNLNHRNTVL